MGKGASRCVRMPAQELGGTLRRSTGLARHRCDQVRGSEPKPQLRHSLAWDAKAPRRPWGSNQEGRMWGDPVRWPWRSALQFTCKEPGSTRGPSCCPGHPLRLHRGHVLCQRLNGDKATWSVVGAGVVPRGNLLLSQARIQDASSSVLPGPSPPADLSRGLRLCGPLCSLHPSLTSGN